MKLDKKGLAELPSPGKINAARVATLLTD